MVVITRQFDLQRKLELEASRGALSPMSKRLKKRDDVSSDDRGENDNHHHGSSDSQRDDDDDDDDDRDDDDDDDGGSRHSTTHTGIYTGTQGSIPATATGDVFGNPVPTWLVPDPDSSSGSSVMVPHLDPENLHQSLSPASIGGIIFTCIILLFILLGIFVCIRRRFRRHRLEQMKHLWNVNLMTRVRSNNNNKDRDPFGSGGDPIFEADAPAVTAFGGGDCSHDRTARMFAPSARSSFDGQDNVAVAANRGRQPAQVHELSNLPPSYSKPFDNQADLGYCGLGTRKLITTAPIGISSAAGYPQDIKVPLPSETYQPSRPTQSHPTTASHVIGTDSNSDLNRAHSPVHGEDRTEYLPLERTASNPFREKMEARAAFERALKSDSQVSLPLSY